MEFVSYAALPVHVTLPIVRPYKYSPFIVEVVLLLTIRVVDAAARGVCDFLIDVAYHSSAGGGGG